MVNESTLQAGVVAALDGMFAQNIDVRLWIGAPALKERIIQRIAWIEQNLGEV